MEVTVFYAWQADRSAKTNRCFIRDAAKVACERITRDAVTPWSVTLDSDTQGVAGMCDIPNTIQEKIQNCDIFLADLSFVGRTDDARGDTKQMPNLNVLFELGFAAKCHGFGVLVGVINEAFGTIAGQVFDIKRRASLTYSLPEDADAEVRRRERDRLSQQLESIFRTTLETVVSERHQELGKDSDAEMKRLRAECAARVLQGAFHGFKGRPATLVSVRARRAPKVDFEDVFDSIRDRGLNPQAKGEAITWSADFRAIELDLDNAILFQAFGGDYESFKNEYSFTMHSRGNTSGRTPCLLRAEPLQMNIVRHVHECCHLLDSIGLEPPWDVGVSLLGANGFQLVIGPSETSDATNNDDIHLPPCVVPDVMSVADRQTTGTFLRETLNRLLRQFGVVDNSCFDSHGNWCRRDLG